MSVTSVTEIWEGREATVDNKGTRTYVRVFRVVTDDFTDGGDVAISGVDPDTSLSIPEIGDAYGTGDAEAKAVRIKPSQVALDARHWIVSVEYTSDPQARGQSASDDEDPLLRAPVESITFSRYTEPLEVDRDGNLVRNSAGDRFDPLPEVERSYPVLTIQRNESGFQYSTATTYVDTVNLNAFRGAAAGEARIIAITASSRYENGTPFFEVTYEIAFKRDGWAFEILDRGYRYKDGSTMKQVLLPVYDTSGNPMGEEPPPEPVLLDGAGAILATGGTPQYITFHPYPAVNWSPLSL